MSRAIIFDLDGTLIDSAPDIHRCANLALEQAGHGPITLDQTRDFIGHGAPRFVEQMMAAQGIAEGFDALLAAFLRVYEDAPVLTCPYPGVLDALAAFRAEGWRIGLCTNKPIGPAQVVMDHLGLSGFFDVMLGGDSLPQRKPDPAPLLHVVTALEAQHSLYAGDSEVDAETAQRAGLPFALFTEGYRKQPVEALPHSARFDDFAVLPALAAELVALGRM